MKLNCSTSLAIKKGKVFSLKVLLSDEVSPPKSFSCVSQNPAIAKIDPGQFLDFNEIKFDIKAMKAGVTGVIVSVDNELKGFLLTVN